MSSAPVIGLTTYPRDARGRFHLPVEYVEGVRRAGALAWLIPPGETRVEELLARLDALILTGGGDVDPALYGGRAHPSIYSVDRGRDESELQLARAALAGALPALAICRGCQIVNVALGGTLVEHLPDEPFPQGKGTSTAHRGEGPGTSSLHPVELQPGSLVAGIVGEMRPRTSSSHHQAIRRVAQRLTVTARAPDGTIEAVELADPAEHPFFLGVQWHPEELIGHDPAARALFRALVTAAESSGR